MTRAYGTYAGLALLLCPMPALASDYSQLPVVLYGIFGVIFAVVFAAIWFLTKGVPQRWLRVLFRCAAAASFWAPIDLGTGDASAWWPACCFFLDPPNATEAPASILVTTLLLWLFILCLPAAASDPRGT
ncbi:hypothetical protein ACYX7E_03310 [Luteimonas sp. RIT-PG2_3]